MGRTQVEGESKVANVARARSDRDAEQRWETEGGSPGAADARGSVNRSERVKDTEMWMRASVLIMSTAAAAMSLGCSPQPTAIAAVISERVYTVIPDSVSVDAGIVTGLVMAMRVTERVEEGSGRVATPAKLTGMLVLKNVSPDKSVQLLSGRIVYIDSQGQTIQLDGDRPDPAINIAASYGASDRLNPGQDATQAIDADFPVEALKAKKLKEIRLEISYVPAPFKEETLNFRVSIGAQ